MPARFWFDNRGLKKKYAARGVPDEVIRGLNGDIDRQQKQALARFYKEVSEPIPEDIVIKPKYALYIGGTTNELIDALNAAIKSGINSVCVTQGQLAVWYLRRKIENSEESILCIAGRGIKIDAYWEITDDSLPVQLGKPANYWKEIPNVKSILKGAKRIFLKDLVEQFLHVRPEAAWYPGLPQKVWQWKDVEQKLLELDSDQDKRKHLRSDECHSDLYLHDGGIHSMKSPQWKYIEAVRLIKASINREAGIPGSDWDVGDWVFFSNGITDEEKGLRLGEIAQLRNGVSRLTALLPEIRMFRYDRLPGYKNAGQVGGILALKNQSGFYIMQTHDKVVPTMDQSRWDYTGDKVHVSVYSEQIETAWNVMFPILLDHSDTIKEFKVSDMAALKAKLSEESASRVYFGAQFTIYLNAAAGAEGRAIQRFVGAMKLATYALRNAGIKPGKVPDTDARVNDYVSYRYGFLDLVDPERAQYVWEARDNMTESEYTGALDIRENHPKYGEHKKLMKDRSLYKELVKSQ